MTGPRIDDNGHPQQSGEQHWADLKWGIAIIVAILIIYAVVQSAQSHEAETEPDCTQAQSRNARC